MPPSPLTHLYVAPHLDDAVFSCGGLMHRQAQAGARVVVVTLTSGTPPAGPLSPLAQELHARWSAEAGLPAPAAPADVVALRRNEDLAALAALGAEAVHLDLADAIYRLNPATGWPLYANEATLFGNLHAAELTLVRRIANKLATLTRGFGRHHLYVPLGLGQHVDHTLARRSAETAGGVYAYYEDFPYVAREGERWPHLGSPLLQERPLAPEIVRLDDDDLAAWTSAMQRYTSQLGSFWATPEAMQAAVRQFAERVGQGRPALRLWRVS